MKKLVRLSLGLILLASVFSFRTNYPIQKNTLNKGCEILHEGTFKYGDVNEEVRVVIKGNNHTEYHNSGKYIIMSKLVWVNECEYNMTMTKITIPNFPYGVGDVMNVKINEVRGKEIFYTSTVKDRSWKGKLIKLK
jgi:hypothetical protein